MCSKLIDDVILKIYSFLPIQTYCHSGDLLSNIRKSSHYRNLILRYKFGFTANGEAYLDTLQADMGKCINEDVPIVEEIRSYTQCVYKRMMRRSVCFFWRELGMSERNLNPIEVMCFVAKLSSSEIIRMYYDVLSETELSSIQRALLDSLD